MTLGPEDGSRRLVRQRYALGRKIGGGGQGTTWEAVDQAQGTVVAIKEFRVHGAESWKDVELAEREAQVLSRLHHARLPRYIDHFEEDGVLYLVMEMVEGRAVGRNAALGVPDVLRFLADAADVLDYLHTQAPPVIHRDIKPNNVIKRPDGSFAIVDFGSVRAELAPEGGSTVVGTFGFMAPEQFQGRALPASDVYAVGATAMTMLTGRPPEELPHKGLGIDVRASLAGTAASPRLIAALSRMLEPDPDRRAQRLSPLVEELIQESRRAPRVRVGTSSQTATADRPPLVTPSTSEPAHLVLPPGVAALFQLGLVVARIAVAIGLGVILPTLLTLLSIFFGPALRRAARSIADAQRNADIALSRAAHSIRVGVPRRSRHGRRRHRRPRVRVAPQTRIDVDVTAEDAVDDEWHERDEERRARRRSR